MVDLKTGYVNMPDYNLWYSVYGADKPGVPLLVVNGIALSHDYMEPISELSSDRPVIFYDQRGCGNSGGNVNISEWTFDVFFDEIDALCKELNYPKYHILAHCVSAMISLSFVLDRTPGYIASLIMASPVLNAKTLTSDMLRRVESLPKDVRDTLNNCRTQVDFTSDKYNEAMMVFYSHHFCVTQPWPDCLLRSAACINHLIFSRFVGQSAFHQDGVIADFDLTDRLKDIILPVIYICGQHDEIHPDTVKNYHRNTRDSQFYVIEGASHCYHIEQKEEFFRILNDFLNTH
ncbi:MAG: proline iminopeptidase-family hydrolase [Nitrospirae bacterium]|nr:proline iminopeptidase-family hydrolase [Nitrospirota bacterium]MBF0534051.1 proline iminopeptidase-family hydrolase [Nitrospirota bacterium]MBF0616210.1 proline iminopeptidase-family hydrolase [Nitrospirota bacterium]